MCYSSRSIIEKCLFITGVSILFVGCSSPVHKSLDTSFLTHNAPTTVLSKIPTEEIYIYIEEKQYTSHGGGLIWMLVDKGINKARAENAESRIVPLLEATADVDFRSQYWKALEETLESASWLKTKQLDKHTLGYSEEKIKIMETPILILQTFYQLSPNAQVLLIQTKANLYLSDLKEPDYFGFHTYCSDLIGAKNEKNEKAIALWAADNAAAYRESLAQGIADNMYMLQLDLFNGPANLETEEGEAIKVKLRSPISGETETLRGKVLRRTGNRIVLREAGGNLFSVSAH